MYTPKQSTGKDYGVIDNPHLQSRSAIEQDEMFRSIGHWIKERFYFRPSRDSVLTGTEIPAPH